MHVVGWDRAGDAIDMGDGHMHLISLK
jgi:hypothetical protein